MKTFNVQVEIERDEALRAREFVLSVSDGETEAVVVCSVPVSELQSISSAQLLGRLCREWPVSRGMLRRVGIIPPLDIVG